MKGRAARRQPPPAAEPAASGDLRRLRPLLALLVVAGAAYFGTQGWRQKMLRESANYRRIVAQTEDARRAQESESQAVAAMQAQLKEKPWDSELRLQVAERKWRREGPGAATEVLEACPRPFPDALVPKMLAHCYRLVRREDRALATLDEAIGQFPKNGELHADRALLYVLLAWHEDAARELKVAESLQAEGAILARASLARARGDRAAAKAALQKVLQAHPGDGEAIRQLVAAAQDGGQMEEAARLLRTIRPEELTAEDRVTLAVLDLYPKEEKRALEALETLNGVIEEHPDYARARFIKARCLRQLGRQAEAKQELERLCADFPRMFGPSYELGEIYRKEGRTAEAGKLFRAHWSAQQRRTELRRAATTLMREPDNASAHLEVGKLFLDRGLYGRAIVELQRALQLKPGWSDASTLLAKARGDVTSAHAPEEE
jgi:tetratricopeptide (TPR) repeat protein